MNALYDIIGHHGFQISEDGIVYNDQGLRLKVSETSKGRFVVIKSKRHYIDDLLEASKNGRSNRVEAYQGNDLPWA